MVTKAVAKGVQYSKALVSAVAAVSLLLSVGTSTASAQQISQAQIEQFKQLPRAQQEALARKYGVDLDAITGSGGATQTPQNTSTVSQQAPTSNNVDTDQASVSELKNLTPEQLEQQLSKSDSQLKAFGYDFFNSQISTFAPLSNAPVPGDYIVGIGDTLTVQLYGKESSTQQLAVDREGNIQLKNVGPIAVAGLRYYKVQELIQATVKERMIGVNAAVTMGDIRAMQILVTGEATQPGMYSVSALTSVTQALAQAGGVSEIGSLRNIQVKHQGKTVKTIDLYDLLIKGDNQADIRLSDGDVVFVPPRDSLVTVSGAVTRPAKYELANNETIADVIAYAGGTLPRAYNQAVQLLRYQNGARQTQTVNLKSNSRIAAQAGDYVFVSEINDTVSNGIMLVGAVAHPGYYEYRSGLKISDILSGIEKSLLPHTDRHYGLVVRENSASQITQVKQFDVLAAINGDATQDVVLQQNDKLVLFSRYESVQAEKNQLREWLKSDDSKAKDRRDKIVKAYRKQFYQKLVGNVATDEAFAEPDSSELVGLNSELTKLFDKDQAEDEQKPESYYSKFSRHNLLQPVLFTLRNQYTASGSLQLFYVDGEVRFPGVYPLPTNSSVKNAIAAAGGLKESAYLTRADITRTVVEDGVSQTNYLSFDLGKQLQLNASTAELPQVQLQGRDRLNVLSIPQWQNTLQVTIGGEVRFPGTYAVRRGETLKALLKRAGGLTDYAFERGAVFTREDIKQNEQKQLAALARELRREVASNLITDTGGKVAYSEVQNLINDMSRIEAVGRLVINLDQAVAVDATKADEIILKDGDRLYIPTEQNTVSIIGEVQLASSYHYQPGLTVNDYIEKAGGVRQKGDAERMYIIRASGAIEVPDSSWFAVQDNEVLPGDTIVVPLDSQYMSDIELWTSSTQILYQIGVALAALNGL